MLMSGEMGYDEGLRDVHITEATLVLGGIIAVVALSLCHIPQP